MSAEMHTKDYLQRSVNYGGKMIHSNCTIHNGQPGLLFVKHYDAKNNSKISRVKKIQVLVEDSCDKIVLGEPQILEFRGTRKLVIGQDGFFLSNDETQNYLLQQDKMRGLELRLKIEKLQLELQEWETSRVSGCQETSSKQDSIINLSH
jgi:hypothetical protein